MHWRLDPDKDVRVWAAFVIELLAHDDNQLRFLVRLDKLDSLTASHPFEQVDQPLLERIQNLPGKFAFIPYEAAEGRTLFLKVGTLTGRNDFFFDQDSDKMPGRS